MTKRLTLIVLLLLTGCRAAPDLRITVRPDGGDAASVVLDLRGDADGRTDFVLDTSWGGTDFDPAWISGVTVRGGRLLPAADGPGFAVEHEAHAPLRVAYTLRGVDGYRDVDDYAPLLSPVAVAFFTPLAVPLPDRMTPGGSEPRDAVVEFRWEGLDELGWAGFGSVGFGDQPAAVTLTPDRLHESMFAAGRHDAGLLKGERGRSVVLGLSAEGLSPEAMHRLVGPVMAGVQAYFDVDAGGDYLVTIAAAGEPVENGFALGGTAVTNAFAFYFDPGVRLDPELGLRDVIAHVLCHEYVHNWNGVGFWITEPAFEYESRWFTEGVTDFVARRVLYECGMLDADGYARALNTRIADYESNPLRDLPNAEAAPRWLANAAMSNLMYERGDLIGLLIDERVRQESGGERSLRDLMRRLAAEGLAGRRKIDPGFVYAWIGSNTDAAFAERVRALVEHGGAVPLPERLLGAPLVLEAGRYRVVPGAGG